MVCFGTGKAQLSFDWVQRPWTSHGVDYSFGLLEMMVVLLVSAGIVRFVIHAIQGHFGWLAFDLNQYCSDMACFYSVANLPRN